MTQDRLPCIFAGCNKTFASRPHLNDHINRHLGIKPFKCKICEKAFSCRRYLTAHNISHRAPMPCPGCGKLFTRKYKLKMHRKHHCSVGESTCPVCKKVYTQKKAHYERHVEECRRAAKEREEQMEREENEKRMLQRPRPPSQICACEICKAEYAGKKNLRIHVKAKHEHVKLHCPYCENVYRHHSSRGRHVRKKHNKDWPNVFE